MSSRSRHGRSSRAATVLVVALALAGTAASTALAGAPGLEVRGNRELSVGGIERIVGETTPRTPAAITKRIQSAYIEKGYFGAKVRVETRDADSTLVLSIDEGEPARYGKLDVKGAAALDTPEVWDIVGVARGDRYTAATLRDGFRRLLERYDTEGYPFAQVWIDSLTLDPAATTVDMAVTIVEGGRKTISSVRFEGLEHTREDLAVKMSGLKPGDVYDGERIRAAYLRLVSSGVFDRVSYPEVRVAPDGGAEALIEVVEPKGSNSVSGAIGYAAREGEQDKVLSGVVRLDLTNIGGALRDLRVSWKNDGQGRSETRFSFRDRFFLGHRLGVGVALEQVGLDTVYTWQSLGVESSAPVGRLWDGVLGVEVGVYGDRNTFSQGDVSNTLRMRLTGGVSFVEGNEAHGAFVDFHTRHTYGWKTIHEREGGNDDKVSQYIFEIQVRSTADLTKRAHGALAVVYRGIESSEEFVPLSEQFYIGGAATVRGYRENQFHGRRTAYARSELRAGSSRRENLYLFVDAGYVLEESQTSDGAVTKEENFPVGYGFGLRTESQLGNIDLSFGVGDELSLAATKVHVILNRTF